MSELNPRVVDAVEGLVVFLEALKDGAVSPEELAEAIDAAVDTGPLDEVDDPFILAGVEQVFKLVARDPSKMRERADRLEAKGKTDRAEKLRERADRVEARQE